MEPLPRNSQHPALQHPSPGIQRYCCSAVSDSLTTWAAARQASLSLTVSWSLLKLMSIELVISSNHLILCCPLLLLPSTFLSIRVFSSELASLHHQVAKVLELWHQFFQ